jgi:hypothetical protein
MGLNNCLKKTKERWQYVKIMLYNTKSEECKEKGSEI